MTANQPTPPAEGTFSRLMSLSRPADSPPPADTPAPGSPKNPKASDTESLKDRKPESLKSGEPENGVSDEPESQPARKPDSQKTGLPATRTVKYSTLLRPDSVKTIKRFALERDCKGYEIVQEAVDTYLIASRGELES